ncbi:hypothetical protein [Clostridium akagii]|uniref:hypothetical protein n=1 Tax=Clostridium akagii TaxID=91623 RepID=UPI000479B238|nr:hypothetical protein [Clostridium akagii]
MIKKLLKINLKGTNNKKHILILIIISIMITNIQLSILNITGLHSVSMGDILILAFGGLNTSFNITKDLSLFVTWMVPNIMIVYLINTGIIHKFRERTILILPRVKLKLNWSISYNITIWIIVVRYYLVLFSASFITIFIRMGYKSFLNTNILINNYNQLTADKNQYLIVLYIILLNTGTMICLISFINNIYYIFFNSNHAAVICMMICFITVITTKFNNINKFILMNQQMLIRHDFFKGGFKDFNLSFSILYLCIFLIINFIFNILIVKKRDIDNI